MIFTKEASLDSLIVHFVGNKADGDGLRLSKSALQLESEGLKDILKTYFLNPFRNATYHHFHHEADINLNELYNYSSKIFADPGSIFLQSINIIKHLSEQSDHPNIKSGEVYVAYFSGVEMDTETVDAIGIFKSENKDTFLKINALADGFSIEKEDGININRLDKGCLIFNADADKGYRVCSIDNVNKSADAQYWKEKFLNIIPRKDSYHYTNNYLDLCKNFVTEKLPEEFEIAKTDQIDMLNRSVNFFKKNDTFDFNEFTNEVIQQPELIDSFKDFKNKFQEEYELPIVDEFEISTQAVKKQARIFKSVLKLDKNFHIYIHGNKELIEKGVDEASGMKYYKIYYREES